MRVGSSVFIIDSLGLMQEWETSSNSLKFGFFKKIGSEERFLSDLFLIPSSEPPLLIALFPTEFLIYNTITRTTISITVDCSFFQYFPAPNIVVCVRLNAFTVYTASTLVVLSGATSPDVSAITFITTTPVFSHIITQQTTGTLSIYVYNTLTSSLMAATIISSPTTTSGSILHVIADADN